MTTRKMPVSVSIMGIPFSIEYKPDLRDEDNSEVMGLTEGATHKITICSSKNKAPDELESVLIHEILHALMYVSGQSTLLDEKTEEAIVTALEHGLSQLYRRKFS